MNSNKRNIAVLALTLLTVTGISACAPLEAPAPVTVTATATETATPTPTPSPEVSPGRTDELEETVFLDYVHEALPYTQNVEDADLLTVGKIACTFFDQGETNDDLYKFLYQQADQSGMPVSDIMIITGAGTGSFCPEYIDKLSE